MKCKYEGSGVWKDRCVGTKEVDPCVGYDQCDCFRPNYKTNADHIRSMTDEELADIKVRTGCPPSMNHITCGTAGTCLECWINWLKQPYKEDA